MPESSSQNLNLPFKNGLKAFGSAPEYAQNSILLSGASPEKVIRKIDQSGETHQQSLETSKNAKKLIHELFTKYGIHTLPYDIVQAPDIELNQPAVYIVTDRVYGHNIADKNIPPEIVKDNIQDFENFYTSLVSYVGNIYVNGGSMLTDIDPHQFMLGHTAENPDDNIYLVDLDPWSAVIEPLGKNKEQEDMIFSIFHTTYECMKITEEKAGVKLTAPRENLLKRLQKIPEGSKSGYYTRSIQPILEDLQEAS